MSVRYGERFLQMPRFLSTTLFFIALFSTLINTFFVGCGSDDNPLPSIIENVSRVEISGPFDMYSSGDLPIDRPTAGKRGVIVAIAYNHAGEMIDFLDHFEVWGRLEWEVSDKSIAEVNVAAGLSPIVTFKKPGTVTINARIGDVVSNRLSITIF